jgi:hypothetical protein
MARKDMLNPDSRFMEFAAHHNVNVDDVPRLFKDLKELPPGSPRPPYLEDFQLVLSKSYGLNELYGGNGFTLTDKNVGGRSGNVGAREVKVSGNDLSLDAAGKGVWWDSIEIGEFTKTAPGGTD